MKKCPLDNISKLKDLNSYRSKTRLWTNWYLPKDAEKKYKTSMENKARTTKETTRTNRSTIEEKIHKDNMEWKDQKKITADRNDNKTGRNKSKEIGGRRENQKIPRLNQSTEQKRTLKINERKFHQQVSKESTKQMNNLMQKKQDISGARGWNWNNITEKLNGLITSKNDYKDLTVSIL